MSIKDGNGNIQVYDVTNDASGNCVGNMAIVDGANAANKVTVKGASTPPVAGDFALVVAISPNSTGVAGTANASVFTVQGIASATPLIDNITQIGGSSLALGQTTMANSLPVAIASNQSNLGVTQQTSPWVENVSQINGVTPLMGNGVTGTGSPRVTISSDNSAAAGIGGSATGSAVPASARYIAGNGSGNLTGVPVCDNWTAINQTGNTQLLAGASSKQTYICHIDLVTATAQNIALLSGTGSTCGTSPHAIAGGTTAATGWNFAANGGIVIGTGVGAPLRTGTAADNVCLFQSGAGQVSGGIQWTQF